MAGLKLKFNESGQSFDEKIGDNRIQFPKQRAPMPRPELVGGDGFISETGSRSDTEVEEREQKNAREAKKKSNKYFYKVSNHHELFKIGSSFYEDYKKGVKSFAVSSTGYQTSQQNSILGLASFFDHKDDLKIAIVSDNLHSGAFKEIVSISKKAKIELGDHDETCEYSNFYGHFDFFDLDILLKIANNDATSSYEQVFDDLVDGYDLVFWDVPELHKILNDSEKYFPVIMKFESLSIIVAQSLSNSSDVKEIQNFFMGYGISLKGLLFDTKQKEKIKEANAKHKKPWWRIFG